MAQVSKRLLNNNLQERIFELFTKTLISFKDPSEVESFIEDFFSPTEKVMLIKRLAIAILLSRGYTYKQIDILLKVSKPTITKVSHHLKNKTGGYQRVLEKIEKSNRKEEFIDTIEELFLKFSPPKAYGSSAFLQKQKQGKKLYKRKLKRSLV